MSTNSFVSVIMEILKLYDMKDLQKTFNQVQQIHVFDADNATMESSSPNPHVKERHQSLKLPDNVMVCSIECLQQLQSHLKLLHKRFSKPMGYGCVFVLLPLSLWSRS